MSNTKSEYVKNWRKNTKLRIIEAMGDKCQCCGYSTCYQAMELHHLDPSKKELSFGKVIANPKKWSAIVTELRKCVLLCANCHREVHAGIKTIPDNRHIFNEDFCEYRVSKITHDNCPVCNELKPKHQFTCSYKCAKTKQGCVNWKEVNLIELKKTLTNTQIGQKFGVSEAAVRKQWKKLAPTLGNAPS